LRACSQLGLHVPEQLALVGFDNVEFGEIALTPLTSVDGSGLIIGQRAMRMLVDRIQNANEPLVKYIPVRIVIQPSLRIRRSCGCQPATEVF
jgi:LacI family transcriptional regulator